ncbi:MAG: adenosine deaminase [Spirochaetales bacterium]|nr:adenosine deaminase [Spirochaetales bacterium]
MKKKDFYDKLKNIPKAEIHLHIEALPSRKFVSKLLSRQDPKYNDMANVDEVFTYDNLTQFIQAFLLVQGAFKEPEDFAGLMESARDYLVDNGIVYAEMFFAPTAFLKKGWKFEQIMDFFVKKIDEIYEKDHIKIRLLIDVSRTFGAENAQNNLDIVLKYNSDKIIGIGLGGAEIKGPAAEYKDVYANAKKAGLCRVAHAGEDVGPESVWDSIKLLDAQRIGHGISSIQDENLVKYLADNKIPLEICPTSNVFTKKYVQKIEDHPIRPFFDKGVIVTVNTDDPTFFNVSLLDEYWNLYTKLNFTLDEIKQIIINAFEVSFMPENDKKAYIEEVNKAWEANF